MYRGGVRGMVLRPWDIASEAHACACYELGQYRILAKAKARQDLRVDRRLCSWLHRWLRSCPLARFAFREKLRRPVMI